MSVSTFDKFHAQWNMSVGDTKRMFESFSSLLTTYAHSVCEILFKKAYSALHLNLNDIKQ